jgi:hypothetical protein
MQQLVEICRAEAGVPLRVELEEPPKTQRTLRRGRIEMHGCEW